ncbi:MAG: DUF2065 domain-containing protein [Magnetococcales bacterium]|nr:DUF2065 domain-containing protein [Magnetococcales bacterium]MBF0293627.1 DUF2065 domain-containing protein [Magnetococcales bacterium]
MKAFLSAFGLMLIMEGMPYFVAPERMRLWVIKIVELPDAILRRTGFALMAIGLLVIWLARG